jgi:urease accessory protein
MKTHLTPATRVNTNGAVTTVQRFQISAQRSLFPFLCLLLFSFPAQAHPGHRGVSGFAEGLGHPFNGLDHLLAMIAVGLWAAQLGGRSVWIVPVAFVGMTTVGGALGWSGVPLPFVEAGVLASVVTLGLLIATASRWPLAACATLVGLFALFHGHAHGAEIPDAASRLTYGLGFVAATACLHSIGVGAGLFVHCFLKPVGLRYAGAGLVMMGILLWLA